MNGLRGGRHLLLAFLRLDNSISEWFGTATLCFNLCLILLVYRYKGDFIDVLWGYHDRCRRLFLGLRLLCFELFNCGEVLDEGGRDGDSLRIFCMLPSCYRRFRRWCLSCFLPKVLTKELVIKNFFHPFTSWIMNSLLPHTWSLFLAERNASLMGHTLRSTFPSEYCFCNMPIGTLIFSSFYERVGMVLT